VDLGRHIGRVLLSCHHTPVFNAGVSGFKQVPELRVFAFLASQPDGLFFRKRSPADEVSDRTQYLRWSQGLHRLKVNWKVESL